MLMGVAPERKVEEVLTGWTRQGFEYEHAL